MKKAYFCRLLFLVLSIGLSGCFAHLYAQESDQHEQNSHANPHVHHVDSSMAISPAFMPVNLPIFLAHSSIPWSMNLLTSPCFTKPTTILCAVVQTFISS